MRRFSAGAVTLAAVVAATATATATAAFAATPVTVGHSAWTWGNPQPQGNTLSAIEFAGGRGYAAGRFGTVLTTDDGGLDWAGAATGITADLDQIRVVDRNTVIVGAGCLLRRSDDGGQTFKRLLFTPSERSCAAGVRSFYFPTAATGYLLLGDGTVLRTDNGGTSFSHRIAIPGTQATGAAGPATATDIYFTSTETGIAVVAGSGGGTIYRTTDGGGSWSQVATAGAGLNGLFFAGTQTGYAVGDGKTVLKTADGGQTWTAKPVPGGLPPEDLTKIRCTADGMTCLVASKQGDRVLRTTNGGTTFTAVTASTQRIFAVAFNGGTSVVGVGEAGSTVVSGDGGTTFTTVGARLTNRLSLLRYTSATVAQAAGDHGSIARTTDGGQTWSTIGVATSADVSDVSFPDRVSGFALDAAGTVLRTADGGASWSPIDTRGSSPRALYAPDANTLLLIGGSGVTRSVDAGSSFAPARGKGLARAGLVDYARTASGALFVYGPHALFVSTNGGGSFKALTRPGAKNATIARVAFVSATVGYVLDRDGKLYATRNGGRRWSELVGTGTGAAYDVAFGDARNGYLSVTGFGGDGGSGYVLRTADGGRTWLPELVSPSPISSRGLVSPGGGGVFALSGVNSLFATANGGDQGSPTQLRIKARFKATGPKPRARRGRTAPPRPGTATISGQLSPAAAGADVFVSLREANGTRWRTIEAPPVSANGTFTIANVRISRSSYVVAQWLGDGGHAGAGSNLLTITLR